MLRIFLPLLPLLLGCSPETINLDSDTGHGHDLDNVDSESKDSDSEITTVDPLNTDDDFDGSSESEGDCDDANSNIYPAAQDTVGDTVDNNCDGVDGVDVDQDGRASVESGGNDCLDTDATAYPGADEVAYDGIDQNCNGTDLTDVDGDGFDSTQVEGGDDCDDTDALINPQVADIPGDGVDNNCYDGVDNLHATLTWNPSSNPMDVVLTFQMHDDPWARELLLYFPDTETESFGFNTPELRVTAVELPQGDSESPFEEITFLYYSSLELPPSGTACVIWGPDAELVLSWFEDPQHRIPNPCTISDPTTW